MLAGSEPTPGSVSANADRAPLANIGRYLSFCSFVPKSFRGWGAPIDWWADRVAATEPQCLAMTDRIRM